MSRFYDVLVSSWTATLLSAALLVTGVLGSVLSSDLLDHFEEWTPSLAWRLVIFGAALFLTILLFFLRQREIDGRRESVQKGLERSQKELDQLPDLIRTMPPKAFLQDLGILTEKCQALATSAQSDEELLAAVHASLQSIAVLARTFDDPVADDAAYCANIMEFVRSEEAEAWRDKIKFASPNVTLDGLCGVLVLCHDMIALDSDADVGSTLEEFALPVPKDIGQSKEHGGAGHEVLPGAPLSYTHKAFQHYGLASEVAEWARKYGNFPGSVVSEIESYFIANPDIGGLVSVPLFTASEGYKERAQRDAVAVLNFHWVNANRLHLQQAAEVFSESVFPLRLILSQLLIKLAEQCGPPHPRTEE